LTKELEKIIILTVKIFLDDIRIEPEGWVRAKTAKEAIELLRSNKVTEISLDHDLGDDKNGTGYDVILWIEQEVYMNNYIPPIIKVHSANVAAREKMEAGIKKILSFNR
jgi:hypothetical protein